MPFTIIKGAQPHKQKTLLYGLQGVGKSTLAAQLSRPLFIDVEGGLTNMDVARTPTVKRYIQAVKAIVMIHDEKEDFKKEYDTIVIDSIDWLVRRAEEHAAGISTIDDKGVEHRDMTATIGKANGGYGNGNKQLENHLRAELMPALQTLVDDGFAICLIAHADKKDLMDAEGFTVTKIAPAIGERHMEPWVQWCDNVFYLRNDNGERKLLLESTDTILAKNRLHRTGEVSLNDMTIQEILQPLKDEPKAKDTGEKK